jgi:hypothetical protein
VAAQLAASQEGLSSMELILVHYSNCSATRKKINLPGVPRTPKGLTAFFYLKMEADTASESLYFFNQKRYDGKYPHTCQVKAFPAFT